MTGACDPARRSAKISLQPLHAPEGLERVFQSGAEIDAGDQHSGRDLSAWPLDPGFVGASRDLDDVRHARWRHDGGWRSI